MKILIVRKSLRRCTVNNNATLHFSQIHLEKSISRKIFCKSLALLTHPTASPQHNNNTRQSKLRDNLHCYSILYTYVRKARTIIIQLTNALGARTSLHFLFFFLYLRASSTGHSLKIAARGCTYIFIHSQRCIAARMRPHAKYIHTHALRKAAMYIYIYIRKSRIIGESYGAAGDDSRVLSIRT